jgi:Zn-dependent protease
LRGTIPLGRWFGVAVAAHWSALITWGLVTVMLGSSVLPAADRDAPTAVVWLASLTTALAFLASVLAHELAHARTARRHGLHVGSVTLWMLGGVTALDDESPDPRTDAMIAASGPAVSLVIGVVATAAGLAVPVPDIVRASLIWLGSLNLVVAVFNLLPGAPLDGGRLLRAFAWSRSHDRASAAARATRAGRTLGFLLVCLGLVETIAGQIGGLWLAIVGWFLVSAAEAETVNATDMRLGDLHAGDVMRPITHTVPCWWTVERLVSALPTAAVAQPLFPLTDIDGQIVGSVSLADLARVAPDRRADVQLRELARRHRPVAVARIDADLADVAQKVRQGAVVVVTDDTGVVGLITATELSRASGVCALGWRPSGDQSR